MIKITYHKARHELAATGHAGYNEAGKDIVCAAVTALMLTAAQFAEANSKAEIRTEPGDLYVRCLCSPRWSGPVELVLSAIAGGLARTAREYPEYAEMEVYA